MGQEMSGDSYRLRHSRKKFRVRYHRIVSFDPYDDGFGIMRDAQTARPQSFRQPGYQPGRQPGPDVGLRRPARPHTDPIPHIRDKTPCALLPAQRAQTVWKQRVLFRTRRTPNPPPGTIAPARDRGIPGPNRSWAPKYREALKSPFWATWRDFQDPATQASRAIGTMAQKGLVRRIRRGHYRLVRNPEMALEPDGHNLSNLLSALGKELPL